MSEETVIDLKLKNQKDKFSLMFEQNTKDHLAIQTAMTEGFAELGNKIDEIGNNKANKWVENVVKGFLILCGSGIISFIGYYLWALIRLVETK